jgi:hypothetical protein
MLPDLQLICHPPSNGGVVWRIDACKMCRVAVLSAYATIPEFPQLLIYRARLQLLNPAWGYTIHIYNILPRNLQVQK